MQDAGTNRFLPATCNVLPASQEGFLLIEALIAILLLSLVLTASLGGIAQALRLSKRGEETTKAVLAFENLLFDLETGERLDLVYYGGKGRLEEGYDYEINPSNMRLSWKQDKEFLDLQTFFQEAPTP